MQRFLYVTANVFLLLLGIRLALGSPAMSWLQGLGARAFGGVVAVTGHVLHRSDVCGRLALGLVWGLVPCALVYSVLPLALFSGGAWQGAAVMLAFGAGTVPNLLAVTLLVRRIARWSGKTTLRFGAAGLLMAFGVAGIYRVLFVPGALAHGAFCLVP